jgi:general L-amino acid transport system permease protein
MPEVALRADGDAFAFWRDKRIRAIITQILVIAALFAFFAYIISNAQTNLEALGKDFGFEFLGQPASYDINQTFIEYDSRSPHWKAGLVGLLNTLIVAICGIIFATILGFTLGVLRLSNNWLVSRLVYCYVEATRNVPLLVQILLWHGIIVHSLPHPKVAETLTGGLILSNRGMYMPKPLFEPAFWAVGASIFAAIVFVVMFTRWAKRVQRDTGKIHPVLLINLGVFIGLPLIVYFLAGQPINLEYPALKGFNFKGGMVIKPEFLALWWALSLYTAAFTAEIVRAGIQAVDRGQTEAAFALGVRPSRTLRLVIVPQALRVIVPPLTSQYLNITKNSSLAIAIGYMDIVATLGGITLNQTGREMECMMLVLLIYLCFSLTISSCMNWYNRRIALVGR